MGRTSGTQTTQITTSTTVAVLQLPEYCTTILLRSPASNADNIYIKIDDYTASTSDIILRPGDSFSMDISSPLRTKQVMGSDILPEDFFQLVSYKAAANTPSLEIDAFGIPMPRVR